MTTTDNTITATTPEEMLGLLRGSTLFGDLAEGDLRSLLQDANVRQVPDGGTLIEEGAPATGIYVVVNGELEILRKAGENDVSMAVRGPGEVIGEMSLLDGARRNASVRARTDATVLSIPRSALDETVLDNPEALLTVLRTVVSRLLSAEAHLVQHQKMAALGTMAAGLAHELNNPAGALQRSAGQLRDAIADWEPLASDLGATGLDTSEGRVDVIRRQLGERGAEMIWLNPLERSDREQEVQTWLEGLGVADAWKLAPRLVDGGWGVATLEHAVRGLTPADAGVVLRWLSEGQMVYNLLQEVITAARAISEIVGAVKSYTRLDQAPIQEVDVHEGLDVVLSLMRHKLRGVTVRREYATGLPRVTANATELNQVWTNLIDNALDALASDENLTVGTAPKARDLTIRTALSVDGEAILVEVIDSGPGIPPEACKRIYEPFFTTKPPGQGVGLGLSITYSIIRRHGGDITVASQPGRTAFTVTIPVRSEVT
jgi:signal transduction histidine kinase